MLIVNSKVITKKITTTKQKTKEKNQNDTLQKINHKKSLIEELNKKMYKTYRK